MFPQRIGLSSVSWRCRNSDITLHVCNWSKQGAHALRYPGPHPSVPLSGSSIFLKVQSLCELQEFLHLSEPICKTKDMSLSPPPSPAPSLSPPPQSFPRRSRAARASVKTFHVDTRAGALVTRAVSFTPNMQGVWVILSISASL